MRRETALHSLIARPAAMRAPLQTRRVTASVPPCTVEADYSTTANVSSCTAVSAACDGVRSMSAAPTATSDRVCTTLGDCGPSTYVSGTDSAGNRVCSPCAAGTFSSGTNAAICSPIQTCLPGTYEATAPSPSNNRVCTACTAGTDFLDDSKKCSYVYANKKLPQANV